MLLNYPDWGTKSKSVNPIASTAEGWLLIVLQRDLLRGLALARWARPGRWYPEVLTRPYSHRPKAWSP
jgi:hypothetical protein